MRSRWTISPAACARVPPSRATPATRATLPAIWYTDAVAARAGRQLAGHRGERLVAHDRPSADPCGPTAADVGQRITLRPRSVDPRQQRSGRQELHRRYAARRSWLSGGPPPRPRRRDVPLDVAIAAAE